MSIYQRFSKIVLLLITVTCLLLPAFAFAQDAIGRVIQTAGLVTAVNIAGDEREVARGSEIFEDETITTGPRGNTKLRFTDGAVVTLDADSFFSVDEYEYDGAGGAADTMVMTMARGTMRTLTGVIGDDPADTYELNTPFASIGVRGTEYAIVVDVTGRVRVFVFDGAVSITPPTGGGVPTVVGVGGDADAAEVADENATVVELSQAEIDANPALVAAIAALDTTPVAQDDVARLPSPETAVEVQRNVEDAVRTEAAETQDDANVGERAAGNLVDADGEVQVVVNNDDVINARTVVVISIQENEPDAFDGRVTDVIRASPN